jgi:hypothetical protein
VFCVCFLLWLSAPTRAQQAGLATVSGTVLDSSGGTISAAVVTLTASSGAARPSVTTGPEGTFSFDALPSGSYVIIVKAPGFLEYRSPMFTVSAQKAVSLPPIVLTIASVTTSVVVQPTEVIAAQQITAQERQRVLGIIPDFYTSYVWNAAPLTTQQKFSLTTRAAFDPVALLGTTVGAGIQQARNAFPEYGPGAEGYLKRCGALFATSRTSEFLSRAVFPSLFHQAEPDP